MIGFLVLAMIAWGAYCGGVWISGAYRDSQYDMTMEGCRRRWEASLEEKCQPLLGPRLPTLRQLEEEEKREAWIKLGQAEVEEMLAPYTTPDEDSSGAETVFIRQDPALTRTRLQERFSEDRWSTDSTGPR